MIEAKFKQTELGLIPEDWEVCKIGDFTDIVTGATPSTENPDYWNGHIRWMNSSELNDKIIFEVHGRISKEGYDSASTHMLPINCVLVGLAGQGKTRGTAAINKIELCTNQSIGAILPSENIDSDYLYLYMDSQYQKLRIISSGDGGRGGLSKSLLLNFEIVKPNNVGEQKQVAEALSDVDKLIRELDTLIEKKRSIMQGTMQELLTAHCRLPGFVHPWRDTLVEKCCKITTGESNTQDQIESGIYPFYIRSATVMRSNSYIFDCEGVITIGDGQIGKVFHYVNGKFDLHQRCYLMYDFDDVDAKFFYFLFSFFFYNRVIALSAKATVDSVRRNMIAKMKINIPSTMQEQKAIANILSDMNDGIEAIEAKRDKYIAIRQGMMQQLLTGKIRLI